MIYSLSRQDRDGLMLARLGRIEDAIPYTLPGGKVALNNNAKFSVMAKRGIDPGDDFLINPTIGIIASGSLPANVADGHFASTFTDTTVTWFWDGTNSSRVFVLRRPDGTKQTVPGGSLTVTGLTALTAYQFFAFWSPNNLCTIGWAPGNAGTPAIAFSPAATSTQLNQALAFQNQYPFEALTSGGMTITTAAGGGSGAGGGGGGGSEGSCVMVGSDIDPLGDIAADRWRNLYLPQTDWVHLATSQRTLNCTPDHPVYKADSGKTAADLLRVGDWMMTAQGEEKLEEMTTFKRLCVKIQTEMDYGHLYYANGFLSHNFKALR